MHRWSPARSSHSLDMNIRAKLTHCIGPMHFVLARGPLDRLRSQPTGGMTILNAVSQTHAASVVTVAPIIPPALP